MTRLASRSSLAALLPALLLGACATQPNVPPTVSLDGRSCADRPDLNGARPLTLTEKSVSVSLDETAACWQGEDGAKSTYAAFRLPDSAEPYIITVTSKPLGETLFSPRLRLLDEQGKILRERSRESFMFQNSSLRAGLRARPGERYLIVASDPDSVGQRISRIVGSTQQSVLSTGVVIFSVYTGSEANQSLTYSHNGSVTVSVEPVPKAE